jgi:hypothetical protein
MAKQPRKFTKMEEDKQQLLLEPLVMLNMALRGYNYAVAGDRQNPRTFAVNDIHLDIIRNNRAVAQLHSVPFGAVESLKKIFDEARLPYVCDTKSIERHRKRALFSIDIARATDMSIRIAIDEIIDAVQKASGKNFISVIRKITPRGKGEMLGVKGDNQPSDDPPPGRGSLKSVPRGQIFTIIEETDQAPKGDTDNENKSTNTRNFQMRILPKPNSPRYMGG